MLRGDTVSGITILARDVSALPRNETRFPELFETLREGIYITTPEGRILDANPALVRMLGYESKEDLLKRQVSEILVDPAERKVLQQQVETQPMVQGREITLLRKDGSSIVCMNSATAVRDAGGKVVRYQGAVMDITERREMEHRLHQQQEFARRLVDNFPDLILVLDADSHYTFISPRCRELLGYSLEEAQYMEFGGRTHPEDLPAALSIYKDILAGKQTFASMELRVRHKQGDWRRILFNFSPLSDESFKRQLELTHRQARRAARIVQNLLEFSRPGSSEKKLLDLNNLIERTLQLHEHSLRRNNIEVDFLPDTSLPGVLGDANQLIQVFLNLVTNAEQAIREVRESGRVQIRPGRAGNRLSIAFEDDGVGIRPESLPRLFDPFYTTKRPGGGTGLGLSICMSIIREHGGIIEAEALPAGGSAFTVFLPAAPAEQPIPSAPSETASLGASAVPEEASRDSLNGAAPSVEILKGRSVLVLDDEESLRQLLHEGLSSQGLRVDCAATVEEALALLQRFPPDGQPAAHQAQRPRPPHEAQTPGRDARRRSYDILLCDVHLSAGGFFVDGREAAAQILAAAGSPKPAVVYMSGDLSDSGPEAPARGEPSLLQKPFRISEVLALFREVLAPAEPQAR